MREILVDVFPLFLAQHPNYLAPTPFPELSHLP